MLIRTETAETLAAEGLGRSEFRALRLLSGGVPPRGPQAVRLMKRGLAAPTDTALELTPAGIETLERVTAAISSVHARATSGLSDEQAAAFREALETVYASLGGDDAMRAARGKRQAHRCHPHRDADRGALRHARSEWTRMGAQFGRHAQHQARHN